MTLEPAAAESIQPPEGLDHRGTRLWTDLGAVNVTDAVVRLLVEEACRIADRLERLDAVLRGDLDSWMTIRPQGDGSDGVYVVMIGSALAEARQQQTALQRIVAAVLPKLDEAGKGSAGASIVDQLAAQRAARGLPAAQGRSASGRR